MQINKQTTKTQRAQIKLLIPKKIKFLVSRHRVLEVVFTKISQAAYVAIMLYKCGAAM